MQPHVPLISVCALLAAIAAIFIGTQPAHAAPKYSVKTLSDIRVGTDKQVLIAQMNYSRYILAHFKKKQYHWRLFLRHSTCWSHLPSRTLRAVCNSARSKYLNHRWLYETAHARYEKMYAPKTAGIPKWLVDAFTCIHRFEGAWNSNTGNGYYGGMQMDSRFMATYGPEFLKQWGTADNWPIWAQLQASSRAYQSRGFTPWPNTARACGLL